MTCLCLCIVNKLNEAREEVRKSSDVRAALLPVLHIPPTLSGRRAKMLVVSLKYRETKRK